MQYVPLIIFGLGIAMVFWSIFKTGNYETNAYGLTLKKVSDMETAHEAMQADVEQLKKDYRDALIYSQTAKTLCEQAEKDIQAVHAYCAKLKESQLLLQNELSNKRPIIKFPPIQVEVVSPKTKAKSK